MKSKIYVVAATVLATVAAALLADAARATPTADLTPVATRASVHAESDQHQTALDADADGRVLVVWTSRRQEAGSDGIYARLLDPLGRPLGPETRINRTLRGQQRRPDVSWSSDGSAWIVWESSGQDGSGSAVVARRFDEQLEPLGGEIAVNIERDRDQEAPVVVTDTAGRALIVWRTSGTDDGIRARLFDTDGGPLTAEIPLSEAEQDDLPATATLGAGEFVVAWSRRSADSEPGSIRGRRLQASTAGATLGPELVLSDSAGSDAIEPAIAARRPADLAASAEFVIAWHAAERGGHAIRTRRFTAVGVPLGPSHRVAGPESGWKSGAAVATTPDGRFMVSYNGQVASGRTIHYQTFDPLGRPEMPQPAALPADSGRDRTVTPATGARRAVWTDQGQLAFAWSGSAQGPVADESAAGVTLLVPPGLEVPVPAAGSDSAAPRVTSADLRTPIPPIWDPDFVPRPRRTAAPDVGGDFGFEAIPGTGWNPPDPELAVGPTRIVVMTNGAIATFDKSGSLQWEDEIENTFGFWGALGADNFVFDPEVMWDPHSQRFMAMACERSDDSRSFFLFAVSKDSQPDDADDWWKYRLDVTPLSGNDIDSPNMSASSDYVLLTADFFGPDKYLLYILEKSSVLSGGVPVTTHELITGSGQQSMGIPVGYDATPTLYILQSTELSNNDSVIFHAITDPFTAYQRQTFTLPVPDYTYPNQPAQLGTTSRPFLFEPRFWSVAQRNGSIWAVHHVNSSRARARWYEFPLNGWPTVPEGLDPSLRQHGEIDLGPGIFTFFPSIHVDASDSAAVTFARSAANEYISIGRAVRRSGDPLNTLRPTQVVQTSQNPDTSGRWGDYSGTQDDNSQTDAFWGHHEITDGGWRTWVARYDLRAEPMLLGVSPLQPGQTVTMTATGATPAATVHFYYSAVGTGISELPGLGVSLSLENAVELGTAVANGSGIASTVVAMPADAVIVQAAETGFTSDFFGFVAEIFSDGFESGDLSAWSVVVP